MVQKRKETRPDCDVRQKTQQEKEQEGKYPDTWRLLNIATALAALLSPLPGRGYAGAYISKDIVLWLPTSRLSLSPNILLTNSLLGSAYSLPVLNVKVAPDFWHPVPRHFMKLDRDVLDSSFEPDLL
ncbi:hypothetical protein KQX54_005837 [Cotesia glomerata]|uniref:Uncharacterized protein n=1 Tax=Cotesia glomerata TaxID=32391 RepID=A0AAV7ICT5_COTGL|nr:hypothetical protein KQX54_005837 [Cotesia glomerata]